MTLDELKNEFTKFFVPSYTDLNQYEFSTIGLKLTDNNIKTFNYLYSCLKSCEMLQKIKRSSKGTIIKPSKCISNCYSYDICVTGSMVRLTLLIGDCAWCIKAGGGFKDDDKQNDLSGGRAFQKFERMCLAEGIDLEGYAVDNGEDIKKDIEKPLIHINDNYIRVVTNDCHHADFNSSYASGLVNTHPEFRKVILKLYDERKQNPISKLILNATIGYMQSVACCGARWAGLSRDAIKDNNDRIRKLEKELIANGYEIVGYNTDGIWYKGEKPYKNSDTGTGLGQWKNDHIHCKFRAKSDGAYEFIDLDGTYTPVVRGMIALDKVKDRKYWVWGDIFKGEVINYIFDIEKGFVQYEGFDE